MKKCMSLLLVGGLFGCALLKADLGLSYQNDFLALNELALYMNALAYEHDNCKGASEGSGQGSCNQGPCAVAKKIIEKHEGAGRDVYDRELVASLFKEREEIESLFVRFLACGDTEDSPEAIKHREALIKRLTDEQIRDRTVAYINALAYLNGHCPADPTKKAQKEVCDAVRHFVKECEKSGHDVFSHGAVGHIFRIAAKTRAEQRELERVCSLENPSEIQRAEYQLAQEVVKECLRSGWAE